MTGTIMLTFWDVREVQVPKKVPSAPSTDALVKCIGNDKAEDGAKAWITCKFIMQEEVHYVLHLGSSPLTDCVIDNWQFNFSCICQHNLLPHHGTRQGSRWQS